MRNRSSVTTKGAWAPCGNWSRMHMLYFIPLILVPGWQAFGQGLTAPMSTESTFVLRGAGGMHPPMLNGVHNVTAKLHLGPTGKPCLTLFGHAQPQTINPNIFEHMISVSNDCGRPIKMQVCYYQSQQCIPINIAPYGRTEAVLGIMPAMSQFQFEYREKFDEGMGGFGTGLN
jgi:hypothetical protein